MIRAFLIFAGFITITIALILIQPTAGLRGPSEVADVTRAESGIDVPPVQSEPSAPPPQPIEATYTPAPEPQEQQASEVFAALAAPPAPSPSVAPTSAAPPVVAPRVPATVAPRGPATPLEEMIIKAVQQGQNDGYIDALINDAVARGRVDAPGEWRTADGRVDTTSLLIALKARGIPAAEGPEAGFYIVRPGDSLASIAYRFYGTTRHQDQIYAANRAQMDTPERLNVGQRLIMPPL